MNEFRNLVEINTHAPHDIFDLVDDKIKTKCLLMDAIVRSLSLLIIPRAVTRFLETYALNIAKLTQPLLANFLRISQTDFRKTHSYIGLTHEPNFLEIGLSPNKNY